MLEAAGIPNMLTGSFASAFHGTPRTTQDVDLVIDPSDEEALARFLAQASRSGYLGPRDGRQGWPPATSSQTLLPITNII
jgi:hypothetical protein